MRRAAAPWLHAGVHGAPIDVCSAVGPARAMVAQADSALPWRSKL